ncbi:MAG: hypothetical protein ABW044_03370 [Cellvibrio sp.]
MPLTAYKKIIIALLLLAFTSQTMASAAMKCQLEQAFHSKSAITDMGTMNHNGPDMEHMHHHMSEIDVIDSVEDVSHAHQTSDCCKTMGQCLLGCSVIVVSTSFIFLLEKINVGIEDFYSNTASSLFISSLYRPPISA